ncbi:hypothetical protein C8R42DRAFT_638064 [Lentinula raphanica]|nr:hypothetical protein C8R42DRAFT_638064 [Lentinula raphanica]
MFSSGIINDAIVPVAVTCFLIWISPELGKPLDVCKIFGWWTVWREKGIDFIFGNGEDSTDSGNQQRCCDVCNHIRVALHVNKGSAKVGEVKMHICNEHFNKETAKCMSKRRFSNAPSVIECTPDAPVGVELQQQSSGDVSSSTLEAAPTNTDYEFGQLAGNMEEMTEFNEEDFELANLHFPLQITITIASLVFNFTFEHGSTPIIQAQYKALNRNLNSMS